MVQILVALGKKFYSRKKSRAAVQHFGDVSLLSTCEKSL